MLSNVFNSIKEYLTKHIFIRKLIMGFLLLVCIWISYDVCVTLGNAAHDRNETIRTLMLLVIIVCLGLGLYFKGKNELTLNKMTTLIIVAGFALRMGYAFYTKGGLRQHDVEMYSQSGLNFEGHGHFSYIYILFSTGKLPSSAEWQFYQPPLWHFSSAVFMHVYSFFEGVEDVETLFNACMILSSFVGCLTLYWIKELILEITKNTKIIFFSLLLLAFHPQFFVMAGWMNNDGMSFMFSILALLYTFKFHKERGWINVIISASSLGLGMMSKFNSAILALPMGIILIYDLVVDIKNRKTKTILLQALTFIGICAPLGLWFIIYHISKFGIESIAVPQIDPNSTLGVSSYSIWERFGFPPLWKISENIFCVLRPNENGYQDYNIWLYTFKCSIFGEYDYWQGDIFAIILLVSNILLCFISLFTLVYTFIKEYNTEHRFNNIILLVIYLMSIISYIIFQIGHPVTCTQDFRYMTLVLVPSIIFLGKYLASDNRKSWLKKVDPIIISIICIFVINSILYYCTCC